MLCVRGGKRGRRNRRGRRGIGGEAGETGEAPEALERKVRNQRPDVLEGLVGDCAEVEKVHIFDGLAVVLCVCVYCIGASRITQVFPPRA
jgi:hypothetical protein